MGPDPTIADLSAIWGQPLTTDRLAGFPGPVRAYVAGRARAGDPRTIALAPHAEIVLESGPYVPPHARFTFPAPL